MNVFENLLNFFSLALNNKVTSDNVIPAKSSNNRGHNFVIMPGTKYENANPRIARIKVNINKLRMKRFTNSFILTRVK
jgi:hypothetical protein